MPGILTFLDLLIEVCTIFCIKLMSPIWYYLRTFYNLGIQVKIWKCSEILEALIVGKKMNADNNTKNIILISVSGLMSLEVQSCNFWEDGRFFPLWTSKDIKELTKIKIIFLVLLSEFIFFTNDERLNYFCAFSYFILDT